MYEPACLKIIDRIIVRIFYVRMIESFDNSVPHYQKRSGFMIAIDIHTHTHTQIVSHC